MSLAAAEPPGTAAGSESQSPEAVLGVARSLTGRRWQRRAAGAGDPARLARQLDLPPAVADVLAARGVDAGGAASFLAPTLRALLPDPARFTDMEAAADRLARAVRAGEGIALLADYDADGASSAALLLRYLRALGSDGRLYVPDRLAEGYGPNPGAMDSLAEAGCSLVLALDCGIAARESAQRARARGLDLVVVDHHGCPAELPAATALVNPQRDGHHTELAAVGVAFLLVVAANRRLRGLGAQDAGSEPDPRAWLDLVALGTVCDVVPLTGVNRAFAAQGLKVMARRQNPGFAALADSAGLDPAKVLKADDLGFALGPRINAAGRIGTADLGHRLLASASWEEAQPLAARLDELNAERRRLERRTFSAARTQVDARLGAGDAPLVVAAGQGWHPGIVGIVAGRLAGRYAKPCAVVALNDGVGTASARSVPGIDLGAAVMAAKDAGLLRAGGGHPMAAGFAVDEARLGELETFLAAHIAGQCGEAGMPEPALELDGTLAVPACGAGLADRLAALAPFGPGNAEPRFALPRVRVHRADVVGDNHVRCVLGDASGQSVKAIAFRALDSQLGEALLGAAGTARTLHVAGALKRDDWGGPRGVQLIVADAAWA